MAARKRTSPPSPDNQNYESDVQDALAPFINRAAGRGLSEEEKNRLASAARVEKEISRQNASVRNEGVERRIKELEERLARLAAEAKGQKSFPGAGRTVTPPVLPYGQRVEGAQGSGFEGGAGSSTSSASPQPAPPPAASPTESPEVKESGGGARGSPRAGKAESAEGAESAEEAEEYRHAEKSEKAGPATATPGAEVSGGEEAHTEEAGEAKGAESAEEAEKRRKKEEAEKRRKEAVPLLKQLFEARKRERESLHALQEARRRLIKEWERVCDNMPSWWLLMMGNDLRSRLAEYCPAEYQTYLQARERRQQALADRLVALGVVVRHKEKWRTGAEPAPSFGLSEWVHQSLGPAERIHILAQVADQGRVRDFIMSGRAGDLSGLLEAEGVQLAKEISHMRDVFYGKEGRMMFLRGKGESAAAEGGAAMLDKRRQIVFAYSFSAAVAEEAAVLGRAAAAVREKVLAERLGRHPHIMAILEWLRDNQTKAVWASRTFGTIVATTIGAALGGMVAATARFAGAVTGTVASVLAARGVRRWSLRGENQRLRWYNKAYARYVEKELGGSLTNEAIEDWEKRLGKTLTAEQRAQRNSLIAAMVAALIGGGSVRTLLQNPEIAGNLWTVIERALELRPRSVVAPTPTELSAEAGGGGPSLAEQSPSAPAPSPPADTGVGGDTEALSMTERFGMDVKHLKDGTAQGVTDSPETAPRGPWQPPATGGEESARAVGGTNGLAGRARLAFSEEPSVSVPGGAASAAGGGEGVAATPQSLSERLVALDTATPAEHQSPPTGGGGEVVATPQPLPERPVAPDTASPAELRSLSAAGGGTTSQPFPEQLGDPDTAPAVESQYGAAQSVFDLSPQAREHLQRLILTNAAETVTVPKGATLWDILAGEVRKACPQCSDALVNNIVGNTIDRLTSTSEHFAGQANETFLRSVGITSGDPNLLTAGSEIRPREILLLGMSRDVPAGPRFSVTPSGDVVIGDRGVSGPPIPEPRPEVFPGAQKAATGVAEGGGTGEVRAGDQQASSFDAAVANENNPNIHLAAWGGERLQQGGVRIGGGGENVVPLTPPNLQDLQHLQQGLLQIDPAVAVELMRHPAALQALATAPLSDIAQLFEQIQSGGALRAHGLSPQAEAFVQGVGGEARARELLLSLADSLQRGGLGGDKPLSALLIEFHNQFTAANGRPPTLSNFLTHIMRLGGSLPETRAA